LVFWFAIKTYKRNFDWKDDNSIYRSAVEVCPNSAKAQMLYGQELQVQGFWKECIPYLQRALQIEPDFCETAYSLGVAQYHIGEIIPGLRLIQRGVQCNFTTDFAIKSLFAMYTELLTIYPDEELVARGYAELLEKTGNYQEAAATFFRLGKRFWDRAGRSNKETGVSYVQRAVTLYPGHCEMRVWLGVMSLEVGRLEAAADNLEAASWEFNCSTTYTVALDRLIGVFERLAASPNHHDSDMLQRRIAEMIIRAKFAAADLTRKQETNHR
jgi:tetratricopeptide (TPR) repeat protein